MIKLNSQHLSGFRRGRIYYLIAVFNTVLFGLASRRFSYILPEIVVEHAGDILWAMMVYFGLRFLLPNRSYQTAFWLALIFCFVIEFSQLYQADWINQVRRTLLGGLVLGKGFLVVDLIRYSIGIVAAVSMDKLGTIIMKMKNRQK